MRAIFMGRKPAASDALRRLIAAGVDVSAVVAPQHPAEHVRSTFWRPLLRDTARELGLPVVSDTELYRELEAGAATGSGGLLADVDLVISVLFWKKIKPPLIELPRIGCFNFHPGPLPEFRGRRGYNHAILEGHAEYGASVHWVTNEFDEGDLVAVRRFPIQPGETAFSLERRTMNVLLDLFDVFLSDLLAGKEIPRIPQGPGRTATKRELLELMMIQPSDDAATIERKVRAFWYPPHTGATLEVGGRRYTLVDEATLARLGQYLHGSRSEP